MTKKDYELVAKSFSIELNRHGNIDEYKASSIITWIMSNLCRDFARDNPAFDKDKFIKASGLNDMLLRADRVPITSNTD